MGILKIEKAAPPKYTHQEYPKHMYSHAPGIVEDDFGVKSRGTVVASREVTSPEEEALLAKAGWVCSPADLPQSADATPDIDQEQVAAMLDENEQLRARLAELEAKIGVNNKGKGKKSDDE